MWPFRVRMPFGPNCVLNLCPEPTKKCTLACMKFARAHLLHEWGQFGTIWAHLARFGHLLHEWVHTCGHRVCTHVGTIWGQLGSHVGAKAGMVPYGGYLGVATCVYPFGHISGHMWPVGARWPPHMVHFRAKVPPAWQNPKLGESWRHFGACVYQIGTYLNMREITLMRFCIQLCTNACHIVS